MPRPLLYINSITIPFTMQVLSIFIRKHEENTQTRQQRMLITLHIEETSTLRVIPTLQEELSNSRVNLFQSSV